MDKPYDAVIAGGGPAGLTAALYLARAGCRVLVLEKKHFGGQIAITENVENYPGLDPVPGWELAQTMRRQAERFGAELVMGEVTGLEAAGNIKTVHSTLGSFCSLGILLAPGSRPKNAGFWGEDAFRGRGVSNCATCDGRFFEGKEVFVIGGGYAAAEESVFLARFARHVTVLIRREGFSCPAAVAQAAENHPKITVLPHTVMEQITGTKGPEYARYKNIQTGEITEYRAPEGEIFGVFVFTGYAPDTDFLRGTVELDARGHIITDEACRTSVDGVYGVGDACVKSLRQVVTAVADGALGAVELEQYVAARRKQTLAQESL